jgi:3-dehydroquinate synthase
MDSLTIKLEKHIDDSYQIIFGNNNAFSAIKKFIDNNQYSKIVMVMDSNLDNHYIKTLKNQFENVITDYAIFPAGEAYKNMQTLLKLSENLFDNGLDRKSLLIAFGGGVCGDMTGFLASIYMRGIDFIQVPTSILSMVDSSVGGKTGIDVPHGKNLLGAFLQPKQVIMDADLLKTLPDLEWKNGFAEIIKHGLIQDASYFEQLESNKLSHYQNNASAVLDLIRTSCEIKGSVVEKDEKESGLRQILNFGHTIGHAIENVAQFQIPHGFAIALGMLAETHIAIQQKIVTSSLLDRIYPTLEQYGLLDYLGHLQVSWEDAVVHTCLSDKKNQHGIIKVVMLEEIGKVSFKNSKWSQPVNEQEIRKAYQYLLGLN